MSLASAQAAKIELRRSALASRSVVFEARGAAAAAALVTQTAKAFANVQNKIIASYWPIGAEIDCRPAMAALHARGLALCLPVAGQRGDRLIFRRWAPGQELDQGPFGTFHPQASAASAEPDILLVPLLAFDGQGNRLGYGAAFYDRTLNVLRSQGSVSAWGIGFDEQEVGQVPADPYDAKLDGMITDKRVLRFAAAA